MDIIDQIIEIRKKRGISQAKLAEMLGISQPVIARVEAKRSSPTIEFLEKIFNVLDLELMVVNAFNAPREINKIIKDLPYKRINIGRSGDKVYVFEDRYLLKISNDKELLRLEKEKNDWINEHIPGPKTIKYIEDERQGYYLREYISGHTLIEEQYLSNPDRLISILKKVVDILRSLDRLDCPFNSLDNNGTCFVHGDLCLPNIVVDDNDNFVGFLDLANSGIGDKQYDYCWLLWSFEYNLKTKQYNHMLLKELGVEFDPSDYLRYVLSKVTDNK